MARPAPTIFGSRILDDRGPVEVTVDDWRSLYYFNLYRLGLAVFFITVALGGVPIGSLAQDSPRLFLVAAFAYALMAVFHLATINRGRPHFAVQGTIQILADLGLYALLMHASGGVGSGIGLLMLVSVAAAGVALGGRKAIQCAAAATLLVLFEQLVAVWLYDAPRPVTLQIALLGVGLFTTAFLLYGVASRVRRTEALAERRGVDLANLEQVSRLVMERLETGVVVIDGAGRLRQLNSAARRMLALAPESPPMPLPEALGAGFAARYQDWRGDPGRVIEPLSGRGGALLQPRFIPLGAEAERGTLMLLEDMSLTEERAREQRLAALGRLSAALAHEIRNPLGAISHAAELLGESQASGSRSARLSEIVVENCRRINALIASVMQLGRRSSEPAPPLELLPAAQRIAREFCDSAALAAGTVAVEGHNALVSFDIDQLTQVLTNLCQNAVRHTPPGTALPSVRLACGTDTASARPFLDVIDRGEGIPPESADKIFEPFFTTRSDGTGLGLYIARELCAANGAALQHRPLPRGCCFRISFSAARAAAREAVA